MIFRNRQRSIKKNKTDDISTDITAAIFQILESKQFPIIELEENNQDDCEPEHSKSSLATLLGLNEIA